VIVKQGLACPKKMNEIAVFVFGVSTGDECVIFKMVKLYPENNMDL
jgi:hypothetical protein